METARMQDFVVHDGALSCVNFDGGSNGMATRKFQVLYLTHSTGQLMTVICLGLAARKQAGKMPCSRIAKFRLEIMK
jgi:hypothetical protein